MLAVRRSVAYCRNTNNIFILQIYNCKIFACSEMGKYIRLKSKVIN